MMSGPKFKVNEILLNLCSDITRLLGKYEGLSGAKPQPRLRRLNRIRTIQGSLAIEGNSLSLEQVTALLDGKRVTAPKKDILEAQNANRVYEQAGSINPHTVQSMLQAHGYLMKDILPDAGKWRTGSVGIMKGSNVSHFGPKAKFVQGMIKDLLKWVRSSETSPLITSSVFHHQFELIHPFSDGNGRMGRLWQHLMLLKYHAIFEYVPMESVIRDRQEGYYKALEAADRADDSTVFVEFMLRAILQGTQELLGAMRVERVTGRDRLSAARERFEKDWFSRKDYQGFYIKLSAPTASRDLKLGVDEKALERKGDKALARYRFK